MRVSPWVLVFLPTLSLGCGGGGEADDGGGADAGVDCSTDPRGEAFTAGMSKQGAAGYTFVLVDSMPTQPSKNDNVWTVEVRDPAGQPAEVLLTATPFMPDHHHGTPIEPVVTAGEPGRYTVDPINLWMPSLWEITLRAFDGDTPLDEAVFRFCIDG